MIGGTRPNGLECPTRERGAAMERADDQGIRLTGARMSRRLNMPVIAARPPLSSIPSPG